MYVAYCIIIIIIITIIIITTTTITVFVSHLSLHLMYDDDVFITLLL